MQLLIYSGLLVLGLAALLTAVALLLGAKFKGGREENSPFECGFDPLGAGRKEFSVRFFLIAVIFLIFDVEIALLLPLVLAAPVSSLPAWECLGLVFLLVLLVGVYFEWQEGALDWKS